MRALWLTLGSVLTVIAVTVSTAIIWRGFATAREPTETTERVIAVEALTTLRVIGEGAVSVQVHRGEAGQILLVRSMRWSQEKPSVAEDWDGRTLRLDSSCPGAGYLTAPVCEIGYQILVPQHVSVDARTASGFLAVDDIAGDVRVATVSGAVRLDDLPGKVHARSGSGSVRGDSLRSEQVDVEVSSGDLDLSFMTQPSEVRAIVKTSGNIDMELPPGAYDLTTSAPQVITTPVSDPGSSRKITVSTPDGEVSICC
ncbi:DUF4097 family beta strand repeat-containing protein [Nonomuraea sp. NPDC049725]|uniref:DUF4097 family beta strand repeat-containing protein n=1 Tax=Nonomuraea sp. NPDC049725 TaxID=3154508 RepID=UPI003434306D